MPIIIIENEKINAELADPGLYGSIDINGEMVVKTHRGFWFNTQGTELTPKEVLKATIYDDPTNEEINESRLEGHNNFSGNLSPELNVIFLR